MWRRISPPKRNAFLQRRRITSALYKRIEWWYNLSMKRALSKVGFIYALSDETGIRYVGQTTNIRKRYSQHCSLAQNLGNSKKQRWIRSLLESGSKPNISILKETLDMNAEEIRQIKLYKSKNCILVNSDDGGPSNFLQANRAKQLLPWKGHLSPVQRRLKSIREGINISRKKGNQEFVKRAEIKQIEVLKKIKPKEIRDYINFTLWEKVDKYLYV